MNRMTNFNPLDFIANHAGMNLADAIKEAYEHGKRDAEPERKKGRWQLIEMPFEELEAKCSNCGFKVFVDEPGNGLPMLCDMNFCPSCGADMREDGAE